MTVRLSSGLESFIAKYGSLARALHGGKLKFYTGTQPASADAAPVGTLLCTITDASGAHTAEVVATGTVTLTGGASGSVNTVTVDSIDILGAAVSFSSDLTTTAALVAAQINRHQSNPRYRATSSGAVVTIYAMPGIGTGANGLAVSATLTTITASYVNMGSAAAGVNSANGLKWGSVSAGALSKLSTQTWSGVNAATGTAGWARFESAQADSGALDSTESQLRVDFTVATSGGDINLSSTAFTSGATTTLSSASLTVPANA